MNITFPAVPQQTIEVSSISFYLLMIAFFLFSFKIMFMRCECGALYHTRDERNTTILIMLINIILILLAYILR